MKKLLCIFLAALISISAFAKDVIYVGTNPEFEPFEYMEKGEIKGFDIDLINEISKLIDVDIEIKSMAFDGLLPALQMKKIDIIIAGMTATDERKKFVNFSKSYYLSEQAIVVNSKSKVNIKSFDDLKGKKVGVVLGYTGDVAVTEVKEIKVQRFNGTGEGILALKAQKIDAFVLDIEPAKNYALKNKELKLLDTEFAKEEYAIAMRKDDTELQKKINKALDTLKSNGKYDNLIKKYFPDK